jgi:hypothetical protein
MGTRSPTPDLFSPAPARKPSPSSKKPPSSLPEITHPSSRHVLPADLPNAIKQLDNQELDRLLAAVLTEQKRRGRKLPVSNDSRKRQLEIPRSLTQGQLNAVRATFKPVLHHRELRGSSEFPNRMCAKHWPLMHTTVAARIRLGETNCGRLEMVVTLGEWVKHFFSASSIEPPDALELEANSESELLSSLSRLRIGQKGWVTLGRAASLFSPMENQYAFGELDDEGKRNLSKFAAGIEHRSSFEFMPAENRVYFTRKA